MKKSKIICLFKEVNINEAVSYNSAAIKSARYNPKRRDFFRDLDRMSFEHLVKKYCSDPVLTRIKRKIKLIIRSILKELGLLDVIKGYIKS